MSIAAGRLDGPIVDPGLANATATLGIARGLVAEGGTNGEPTVGPSPLTGATYPGGARSRNGQVQAALEVWFVHSSAKLSYYNI